MPGIELNLRDLLSNIDLTPEEDYTSVLPALIHSFSAPFL